MMKNRGFTLIELIVVVIILGILAAVAAPRFLNVKDDAEKSSVQSTVGALSTARSLWMAKALVCGSGYIEPNIGINAFIHLDSRPSRPPTCDDFKNGFGNATPGPVGTIDFYPIKQSLQATPTDPISFNLVAGRETMSFTSKTGRTINIVVNLADGATTWSASPSY
jgi:prepilin-type N-terminal cleavage/methylation domain-containing protein